jgi:hypothetical protein
MYRHWELACTPWKGSGEEAINPVSPTLTARLGSILLLGYDTLGAEGRVLAILKNDRLVEVPERAPRSRPPLTSRHSMLREADKPSIRVCWSTRM